MISELIDKKKTKKIYWYTKKKLFEIIKILKHIF